MAHEAHGTDSAAPTGGRLATSTRSTLLGAMFLMATSAIGPGFITQTTTFTVRLGAAFAFAIVISILVDIALQLNVWRVIGVSGRRAQELGNLVLPGLGWVMAAFLLVGGLVFNIGNVAGSGLGLDAMLGLDPKLGGALSALIAIGIFLSKKAGLAVDRIVVVLGLVMIVLTTYVAFTSGPPVGEALKNVVLPEQVDVLAITTLVGGTIGGYIVYAGAHRLLDSGVSGAGHVRDITRGSITGILITAVMRVVLFLAILGVVAGGAALDPASPAASAFQQAAGEVGLRVFGIVLWAAAITSVIGASYTSVSFVTSRTTSDRTRTLLVVGFIAVTTAVYLLIGTAPTTLLVFAGAFNGLLLPIGIAVLLWVATRRADLLNGYRYPRWLLVVGWVAWLLTLVLAVRSVQPVIDLFR
ncbi:divalent metal cation transporter [Modestobacter muralis]|uniref:Divalent metal cation transporter n=1 Tax=Modestobacter muralis TaxID=1608614 RepID=A0A6P0H6F8_9ACTN|nr:NRAMP family divalent metal transporter [Modestobacter muralis]NEK93057.1 divalent metal cation transporter [Modestobacter muralis]NEN49824.1 divalent metal cation transporter [Modestobacter muralis]